MATGVGGPAGLALMAGSGALLSGGINVISQKSQNGSVDWKEAGMNALIGGASSLIGGGIAMGVGKAIGSVFSGFGSSISSVGNVMSKTGSVVDKGRQVVSKALTFGKAGVVSPNALVRGGQSLAGKGNQWMARGAQYAGPAFRKKLGAQMLEGTVSGGLNNVGDYAVLNPMFGDNKYSVTAEGALRAYGSGSAFGMATPLVGKYAGKTSSLWDDVVPDNVVSKIANGGVDFSVERVSDVAMGAGNYYATYAGMESYETKTEDAGIKGAENSGMGTSTTAGESLSEHKITQDAGQWIHGLGSKK